VLGYQEGGEREEGDEERWEERRLASTATYIIIQCLPGASKKTLAMVPCGGLLAPGKHLLLLLDCNSDKTILESFISLLHTN